MSERGYERKSVSWSGASNGQAAIVVNFAAAPALSDMQVAPEGAVLHVRLDGPTELVLPD